MKHNGLKGYYSERTSGGERVGIKSYLEVDTVFKIAIYIQYPYNGIDVLNFSVKKSDKWIRQELERLEYSGFAIIRKGVTTE